MKIKTTNGKTVDTKTLSDRDSEITEALNNLYETCNRYNATMVARVILNDKNFIGAQNLIEGPTEKQTDSMMFMFDIINKYVTETSLGQIQVVRLKGPDEYE